MLRHVDAPRLRQRRGERAANRDGATTRTSTRAGRVGAPSERKSRTKPLVVQYGHAMGSAGRRGDPTGATGASHRGHASVPVARRQERTERRSS